MSDKQTVLQCGGCHSKNIRITFMEGQWVEVKCGHCKGGFRAFNWESLMHSLPVFTSMSVSDAFRFGKLTQPGKVIVVEVDD